MDGVEHDWRKILHLVWWLTCRPCNVCQMCRYTLYHHTCVGFLVLEAARILLNAVSAMKHRLRITSSVSPARDASLSPSPSPRRALHIRSSVSPERHSAQVTPCADVFEKKLLKCKVFGQSKHYKKSIVRCRGSLVDIHRFVRSMKQDNCKVFGMWRGTFVRKML